MSVSLVRLLVEIEALGEPGRRGQVEGGTLGVEQVLGRVVVGELGPEKDEFCSISTKGCICSEDIKPRHLG